jgi:hypothetical protein
MRAKEFIAERQQLDEFLPAIFAIPAAIEAAIVATLGRTMATVLFASLEAWFIADSVRSIVETLESKNYDIDKLDAGDWFSLVFDIVIGGLSGKALFGMKDKIIAALPSSVKESLGNYFKTTFEKQVKDEIAKKSAATATPKPASTGPKDPNKIDRPFSKDAPASTTTPPTGGTGAFDKMAQDLTKKPKNPNLVDRPFSK